RRLVALQVWYGWLPIGWRSVQRVEPATGRITFRQISGIAAGTRVELTIRATPDGSGTAVTIEQQPAIRLPYVGRFVADRIAGPLVGRRLAVGLLRDLKHVAEGGSLAGSR